MSDGWQSARVLAFEQVSVDTDMMVLRLSVQASSEDAELGQPMLLIADGERTVRVMAAPAATAAAGSTRLAYAVAPALLTPTASFALELPTGRRRLEAPVPVAPSQPAATGGESGDAAATAAELADLQVYSGELERRLTEVTNELAATKSEVRANQSEIETGRSGAESDRAEVGRLRSQLAKSQARIELIQAQAARDRLAARSGGGVASGRLRAERVELARHVRALSELLADELTAPAEEASAGADEAAAGAPPEAGRRQLASIRRTALSQARSQAQRELAEALANTPG